MTTTGPTEKPRPTILLPPDQEREPGRISPRLRGAAIGAVAGALLGYFLIEFGLRDVLASLGSQELLFGGLLLGAAVGAFEHYWPVIGLDALMCVAYLVIGDTPMMNRLSAGWVRSDPIPASADAIVVLSAGVSSNGMLNSQGVQRLLSGLELFKRGAAPRLFTTTVEQTFGNLVVASTGDQRRLVELAGAAPAWTTLIGVLTTRDEALQSAAKLPTDARTVIVVTNPMHTRRACATFEQVGFKVVCVPSREHDHVTWHPLDAPDRLAAFREYVYERLGMVKYAHKGWIP
jgi:uncharacterized SAM-binding protein YcdF (DUF218 family)